MDDKQRVLAAKLTKEFTDKGKLIEAGFAAMVITMMPTNTSTEQMHDMRCAFFLGAEHLFSSIMSVLDPDADETETDLARMTKIYREIEEFKEEFKGVFKHGN